MNMILTYVLESEYLTHSEAQALAEERDAQAASEFEASVPADAKLGAYDFEPQRWEHVR